MVLWLAAILMFHQAEPCSWSLTPGPWLLQRRRRLRIPSAERRAAGEPPGVGPTRVGSTGG